MQKSKEANLMDQQLCCWIQLKRLEPVASCHRPGKLCRILAILAFLVQKRLLLRRLTIEARTFSCCALKLDTLWMLRDAKQDKVASTGLFALIRVPRI